MRALLRLVAARAVIRTRYTPENQCITEIPMKQEFNLIAESREDQGKGASRRLRRQGKVPAILYGGGRPPRALSFDHNKVLQQLEQESFYSSILTVKVGDKSQPAILKDVQR